MGINESNFNGFMEAVYKKSTIPEIIEKSTTINPELAAEEVLKWTLNNVEEFIDNQRKLFKLDLLIGVEDGATETMPNIYKLQELYRAIPNDPELSIEGIEKYNEEGMFNQLTDDQKTLILDIQNCKAILDTVTHNVYLCMKSSPLLSDLFKRMSFYYEMKGISHGNILLQEILGEVDITKFEYEAFPVGVKVLSPVKDKNEEDKVTREYVIPEGFTIWMEIAFKAKQQAFSSVF